MIAPLIPVDEWLIGHEDVLSRDTNYLLYQTVTIDSHTSAVNVYGYTILLGVGIGCYQSAGVAVVTAIAPRSEANHAVSIMTIAQVSGILAALCVTGAIFQNLVVTKVAAVLPGHPLSDIVDLTTGTSSSLFQGLSPELKAAVIAQVTDSIRNVFIYVLAVSALGLVLSLTLSVSDHISPGQPC